MASRSCSRQSEDVPLLDIVGKRYWYFLLSLLIIVPGTIALATVHLKLGTDFTGGTEMTISVPKTGESTNIANIVGNYAGGVNFVQAVLGQNNCPSNCQYIARTKTLNIQTVHTINAQIKKAF